MIGVSIQMSWRKIKSLEQFNAKTDVFPLCRQQKKVKDASAAKRQITDEMKPHVFMGTEELPREYEIKLVTSAIPAAVSDLCVLLLEKVKKRARENQRYERYLTDKSA